MLRSYGKLSSKLASRAMRSTYTSAAAIKPQRSRKRPSPCPSSANTTDTSLSSSDPKVGRRTRTRIPKSTDAPPLTRARTRRIRTGDHSTDLKTNTRTPPKSARPRKASEVLEQTIAAPKRQARRPRKPAVPARLTAASSRKHNDLASFLAYADRIDLSTKSSVYKGTHFEYTVAEGLKGYNFDLQRTGRSNDLGIDLIGHWMLAGRPKGSPLPVLVQCKASRSAKPSPAMIRELEGAYGGAPSGWRHGDGVLALLVTTQPTTLGVRAAIQRSSSPLGVLQLTADKGEVKQFIWNASASRAGLEGLGVVVKYQGSKWVGTASDGQAKDPVEWRVGLTWMGKMWKPAGMTEQDSPLLVQPPEWNSGSLQPTYDREAVLS